MPELQHFEVRLSTAVRSFADRAETSVDATAVAERAIRRRPSAGVGWLERTVSVPVWILLIVLLLALFAVALQVGSVWDVRSSGIVVCPVGTDPDRGGPVGQGRPHFEFGAPMAVDRQSGRLVAISYDFTELWTFDVCTNTWRQSDVPLPTPHLNMPDRVRAIAYDESANLTVILSDPVMAYDVDSDTLFTLGPRPVPEDLHAVYRTATGQLLVRDDSASRLWSYDVAADLWQEVGQRGELPPGSGTAGASLLAYDRSVDRLVLYIRAGQRTAGYEFDLHTSTWLRHPEDPPELSLVFGDLGRHEVAFDEAHARTVLFSSGQVIVYDATARDWQLAFDSQTDMDWSPTPGDPSHRVAVSLVYDPVNERVISVGGTRWTASTLTNWIVADDVIAFDLDTRSWIELLAPSSP